MWSRMENRSATKLKNGHMFRKQDMMRPGQTLKHQGLLLWKTATGRLKGDTGVIETDILSIVYILHDVNGMLNQTMISSFSFSP